MPQPYKPAKDREKEKLKRQLEELERAKKDDEELRRKYEEAERERLELISRIEKLEKPEKQSNEKEKAKNWELESLIYSKYRIAEIRDWYKDHTEIRDWYKDHMDDYWRYMTYYKGDTDYTYREYLCDIAAEGKIVELGKPWQGEHTWQQLAKLRDDTGEIAMQLSGDVVEDEDVSLGDTVRVKHAWVSDNHRGEVTLYAFSRPSDFKDDIIVNPKDSVPFPTREWVEQRLKEIMKVSKYGQDSLKVLKMLVETKHPHKYRWHYEDLVSKTGLYQLRREKIINLLEKSHLISVVSDKGIYIIPYNLRAYLPELLMQYV